MNLQFFVRNRTGIAIAYIAFLGFYGYVLSRNRDALEALSVGTGPILTWMVLVTVISLTVRGLSNVVLFGGNERKLGLSAGVVLALVNTMGNYLPLSGGLIAKGVVLNRRYGMRHDTYAALSVFGFLASVAVSGMVGVSAALWTGLDSPVLLVGFAAMIVAPPALFFIIGGITRRARLRFLVESEVARIHIRKAAWWVMGLFLVVLLLGAWRLGLAFRALDVTLTAPLLLLLGSSAILSRLVALTPGAIGIQEALVGGIGYLAGAEYGLTVVAVGLSRLSEVITVFSLGSIALWRARRGANRPDSV